MNIIDISGQRFGRLTVLSYAGKNKWECRCDCGATTTAQSCHLRQQRKKSCGCLARETTIARNKSNANPDKDTQTPEYNAWSQMKARCYNVKNKKFHLYGGRGITVCEAWRDSFKTFLSDVGRRPSRLHSLERLDNSRGYSPENVAWKTDHDQTRNTRRNIVLKHDGKVMVLRDWALASGINYYTLRHRINAGWPLAKALTTPPRRR